MGRFVGHRSPSPTQKLLLRAALEEPDEARDAWKAWTDGQELDLIGGADYAVLPAIYRNLQEIAGEVPEGERIRGIFRRTWYAGQVLTSQASQAIASLEQAGVRTLLLKGAALMALEPDSSTSVRHMADVDVLVPEAQVEDAVTALRKAGWIPEFPPEALRSYRHVLHGVAFRSAEGGADVDLHWHALEEACRPEADNPFWDVARAASFRGVETRVLSAEDLLLHVCIHGTRGKPAQVIHWVVDATNIINRVGDSLEWDRIVKRARKLELSLALGESFRFLATEFGADIPERTILALEHAPHSRIERLDYRSKGAPPTLFWNIVSDTCRYLRISSGASPWRRTKGFPSVFATLLGARQPVAGST